MILLVSYKLNQKRDYSALYTALKAAPATTWWHYIDNTWLIKTSESADQLHARVIPFLDSSDFILILNINTRGYWGRLPQDAHDWIKKNALNRKKNTSE